MPPGSRFGPQNLRNGVFSSSFKEQRAELKSPDLLLGRKRAHESRGAWRVGEAQADPRQQARLALGSALTSGQITPPASHLCAFSFPSGLASSSPCGCRRRPVKPFPALLLLRGLHLPWSTKTP